MKKLKVYEAASNLAQLIKESQSVKEPIFIEGIKNNTDDDSSKENAILISETNWHSILESLYLHSFSYNNNFIPGELKEIESVPESSEAFYW